MASKSKSENNSVQSITGRHPKTEAFGFSWDALAELLREHEDLAEQAAGINEEVSRLEKSVERAERTLPDRRDKALRTGGEVDTATLEQAEKDLKAIKEKKADFERAAKLVQKDITAVIEDKRAEYLAEIAGRETGARTEADRLQAKLAAVEWELNAMRRLREYLTRKSATRGDYHWSGIGSRPAAPEGS